MEKEPWGDIPGYEGYYQVSDLGRVKSLERTVTRSNETIQRFKGGLLRLQIHKRDGYIYCSLSKKGIVKTFRTYVLVAMAFMDHKPDGTLKIVVDHKDRNKLNNALSNLRLISQRENANKKHLKSSSNYVGVSFRKDRKKWVSQIWINSKNVKLGTFTEEIDAHNAYQNAISKL